MCPDSARCIPVPDSAVDGDHLRLDNAEALTFLGLVTAHDVENTVVQVGTPPPGLGIGDAVDLSLPDVHNGAATPLAETGRPTAIYAWASW